MPRTLLRTCTLSVVLAASVASADELPTMPRFPLGEGTLPESVDSWVQAAVVPGIESLRIFGSQQVYRLRGVAVDEPVLDQFIARLSASWLIEVGEPEIESRAEGLGFRVELRVAADPADYPGGDLAELRIPLEGLSEKELALLRHDTQGQLSGRGRMRLPPDAPGVLLVSDVGTRIWALQQYLAGRTKPEAAVVARLDWFVISQERLRELGLEADSSIFAPIERHDSLSRRFLDEERLNGPAWHALDPRGKFKGFGSGPDHGTGSYGMTWAHRGDDGSWVYNAPSTGDFELTFSASARDDDIEHAGVVPKQGLRIDVLGPARSGFFHVILTSTDLIHPLPRWKG